MKRTPVDKQTERVRGPWAHFGAALLLCLAAAAMAVLCLVASPAYAQSEGDANGDGFVDLLDLDVAVAVVLGEAAAPAAGDPLALDLNGDGAIDVSDIVSLIDRIAPALTDGLASGVPFSSVPESPLRVMQTAPPWVIEYAGNCARLTWAGPATGAAVIDVPQDGELAGTPAATVTTDDIETASSLFWIDNRLRFTVCANAPAAQSAIVTFVDARAADGAGTVSVTVGPALIVEEGVRVLYAEKVTLDLARPVTENSESTVPARTRLHPSYPNPFNPAVTIPYELATPERATLSVYDALGRHVVTLIENATLPAGPGSVVWRGLDESGRSVMSGAYFAVLRSGAVRDVHTMILLR